jgi:L-galactono-1,4-lactone dehydrogenase
VEPENFVNLQNWSGTHQVTTKRLFTPETQQELRDLVAWASKAKHKLRPLGTGLSPNGLALERSGMISMVQLDKILNVDKEKMTITVEGGARVSQIMDELKKHGMTLANFSSITEQQIGGWTQVAAHGTGASIPTVDEMILRMTLVTPGRGVLELSADGPNAELFRLARVGLGSLGVVSEVTLQCVPRYTLHERTYTTTVEELRKDHAKLLQSYRHVRYMWIPFTETVVVVVSDEAKPGAKPEKVASESERVKPLQNLLKQLNPGCGNLEGLNFAQLRERLLVIDPLNPDHVARVNSAEAEFWKLSSGERIADSTEILGFECGGVQWVLENCFPCGTQTVPSLADIDYVMEIKKTIERENIPAASPIEQRWTSASSSPMSPSYSANPDTLFSWVGVIMYITDDERAPAIRKRFKEYAMQHADQSFKYGGTLHWGKLDLNFHEGNRREALRTNMRKRFDVPAFLTAKKELDPHNIFSNTLIDQSFVM